MIWTYMVTMNSWVILATARLIADQPSQFDIRVRPMHPDRCGGLRRLGDFSLLMVSPVVIGTAMFTAYGTGYLGIVNRGSPSAVVAILLLIGVIAPMATFGFFQPLWMIHREMVRHRQDYEDEYADRISRLQQRLQNALTLGQHDEATAAAKELDLVNKLYPPGFRYPDWPFDKSIVLKLLSPQIVAVVSLIVTGDKIVEGLSAFLAILVSIGAPQG